MDLLLSLAVSYDQTVELVSLSLPIWTDLVIHIPFLNGMYRSS